MNRKLLVLFFAMFLLEGVFGLVGAINYTASSSSEVYTGFSWDNYKNYSISWNEYLGNLFYTSGYVGIGTTTPQQKLDVVGNINSTGFINATTDVCIQGGACLSTVSASAGGWTKTGTQVALTTATDNVSIGSTDFFVDNSKGYVGIGTTSPKSLLTVSNYDISQDYTRSTSVGTFTWIELCNVTDVSNVKIIARINSQNNEEVAEILVQSTYYVSDSLIEVTRQTYNSRFMEVRVGAAGYGSLRTIYVKLRTDAYAPTITWSIMGKGISSISNTDIGSSDPSLAYYATLPLSINALKASTSGMTIAGYVGIGTTAPATPLDIDTGSNSLGLRLRGLAETTEIGDIHMNSAGALVISTTAGTGSASFIDLRPEDNDYGLILRESDGTGTASYANFYVTDDTDDLLSINVNSIKDGDALVVTASNNVGIGTTSPQQKLHVNGNILANGTINATTDLCIQGGACLSSVSASAGGWTKTGTQVALTTATDNVSIGSTDFFVDNSKGYVGIGTTGPNATLEVYAGADTTQILWGEVIRNAGNNAVTGYGSGLKLKISGDSVDEIHKWAGVVAVAGTVYANRVDMAFYSSNNAVAPTELMRIRGDGNVGIGTTAPTKKFEVNGTAGAFNVNPDNAGGPLLNTTSGNVTITSAGGSVIIRLG